MEAGGNGTLHAMKDLSGRIAALTPEQRAMFEALRKSSQPKKAAPLGPPPGAIPRRAEGGPAPLSFDQERLWFLHQLDPGETAYNITTVTRLRGALDVACLAAALQEIVRRHEAWRTVLPAVDGRPVQVVLPRLDVPLPVIDLAAVADAGSRALALARQEARRPFDFERGPLVRARLFRVAPEEHLCVLVVHHIVTDWVSFQLAWHELAALYLAFQERKPSPLPPPPIQYADFAVWQRSWMDGEALQRYLDFWLQEIAGAPQALELPTDRPRPAFLSMRGGMARLRVAAADVEALRAVGRKEGATTFMALLAIWGALLERLTGAGKVLISSPNANRGRTETQGLLGFLLTQLVFATDVTGDPTFRELLVRARGTALRAFSHQDLPFGKLVEAVRPERDPSRAPLVQVNLLVLDTDTTSFEMPGLTLENVRLEEDVARFDLGLAVLESAEGFGGFLEFNRDLFDRTTAERLAAAFARVVLQVGRDAEVRVSALDLLGEAARQQVLYEWNDTEVAEPAAPVHELVAAVAARTPGATALLTADGEMTYGELDRLASHLAAGLVERGIGRGARVGLCLERTADLAVAMLGVWKAGAAWVPLDPAYPADRLAFIQEDAGLALVLGGGAPLPGGGSAGGRGDGGEGLWAGERSLLARLHVRPPGRDLDALEALDLHFAGGQAAGLAHVLGAAHVHRHPASLARFRIAGGERGGEALGLLRQAVEPVRIAHDDVRARLPGGVEPEIARLGEVQRDDVVVLRRPPDEHGQPVGGDEAAGDRAALPLAVLGIGGRRRSFSRHGGAMYQGSPHVLHLR